MIAFRRNVKQSCKMKWNENQTSLSFALTLDRTRNSTPISSCPSWTPPSYSVSERPLRKWQTLASSALRRRSPVPRYASYELFRYISLTTYSLITFVHLSHFLLLCLYPQAFLPFCMPHLCDLLCPFPYYSNVKGVKASVKLKDAVHWSIQIFSLFLS